MISDQQSITKAADWIAEQYREGAYGSTDTGLLADGVMALASAKMHRDVVDDMLAQLKTDGPTYVTATRADALAKVILTADIGGEADPAHFFGADRDLVAELINAAENTKLGQAWGGYLATIALSRLGRLGDLSDTAMDYLFTRMPLSKDGGFGWSATSAKGDPDYAGVGISAMWLLSQDTTVAAKYREQADVALKSAIAWSQDEANQGVDEDGDHYWIAIFGGAKGSSANSTGMLASALSEAGVNIESQKRSLKKEQAITESGAAWSNTYRGTRNDVRATVQAIFGITGAGYATANWDERPAPSIEAGTATVSGAARVGEKLTAASDGWYPSDVTLSYAWFRGNTQISGAGKSTYTLTSKDQGHTVKVQVTAAKDGYESASATSKPTAKVVGLALSTAKPTIEGTRQVGHTLTVKAGTWTKGAKLSYQWYRDGKKLTGYTDKTFTLTKHSLGKKLSVHVTGTLTGYETASVASSRTAAVKAGTLKTAKPTISGTRQVGKTLTVKTGTWTKGTKLSYQWYRDGKKLTGYTESTFTLTKYSLGKRLSVHVTGKLDGYTTVSVASSRTATVKAGTLTKATPKISGTTKVGKTLTAKAGTWTKGTKLSYQWYRGGKKVSGATKSTYKLAKADKGHTLKVKVTGKLTGYTTATKTSSATSKIK